MKVLWQIASMVWMIAAILAGLAGDLVAMRDAFTISLIFVVLIEVREARDERKQS